MIFRGKTSFVNSNEATMKRFLITLNLLPGENKLQHVKQLTGLKELDIDADYGLVAISPKRNLYAIRATGDIETNKLLSIQPKVKGIFADTKIATMK
jgi:hypothetical protein